MSKKVQFILGYEDDVEIFLQANYAGFADYRIINKALDARGANRGKKPRVNYNIELIYPGENFSVFTEEFKDLGEFTSKPIIIGAGPGGLFCALRLVEYGIPSIIIERGERAHNRMKDIAKFWRYGIFNNENNVCYGEGGALKGYLKGLITTTIWNVTFGTLTGAIVIDPTIVQQLALSKYNSLEEDEADKLAVEMLQNSNLPTSGGISFFKRLEEKHKDSFLYKLSLSHPGNEKRVKTFTTKSKAHKFAMSNDDWLELKKLGEVKLKKTK